MTPAPHPHSRLAGLSNSSSGFYEQQACFFLQREHPACSWFPGSHLALLVLNGTGKACWLQFWHTDFYWGLSIPQPTFNNVHIQNQCQTVNRSVLYHIQLHLPPLFLKKTGNPCNRAGSFHKKFDPTGLAIHFCKLPLIKPSVAKDKHT